MTVLLVLAIVQDSLSEMKNFAMKIVLKRWSQIVSGGSGANHSQSDKGRMARKVGAMIFRVGLGPKFQQTGRCEELLIGDNKDWPEWMQRTVTELHNTNRT